MRAIAYARYSTDRQSEASIDDQLRICREYAAAYGWAIAAEHVDEAISGAALGNRPGALRALEQLAGGDVLLVSDLSRLSRSQDLAPLLTRLRHRGARVIGVQDGFDSDARHARMQAGLSGIMSEEFRASIADRTRSALELRARLGKSTGGKAFEAPEIVREIFARFAGGESMKAIASDLNRRKVHSPGADWKPRARPRGHWQVSTLHTMLHNERYVGRLVWNRSRWVKDPDTGRRVRRERPESEWVVGTCERLVDAETWEKVQARFQVRTGRGGAPRWILSGILECKACGGKMIVMGGGQSRYICGTYHAGGPHACQNDSTFPRELAEDAILKPVLDDLLSPAAIAEGVRAMREERLALASNEGAKQEAPDRELRELERLVAEGVLSKDVAAPAIAQARRKAQERRSPAPISASPWPSEKLWRESVQTMREILQGPDITAARQVLKQLIGPARCRQAVDGVVVVELTTRHVMLVTASRMRTGTDRRYMDSLQAPATNPSTDPLLIYIPVSSRKRPLVP